MTRLWQLARCVPWMTISRWIVAISAALTLAAAVYQHTHHAPPACTVYSFTPSRVTEGPPGCAPEVIYTP